MASHQDPLQLGRPSSESGKSDTGKPGAAKPAGPSGSKSRKDEPIVDQVRVNTPLVLISVALVAVFAVSVHFLHASSVQRTAEVHLEQAQKAREEGKWDGVVSGYTRYVRTKGAAALKEPKLVENIVPLGKLVNLDGIEPTTAVKVYQLFEHVLRLDPTQNALRRQAVEVSKRVGQYRGAVEHIKLLLSDASAITGAAAPDAEKQQLLTAVERAALLELKGDCHAALKEYDLAQSSYAAALALNPELTLVYAKLSGVIAMHPQDVLLSADLAADLVGPKAEALSNEFPRQKLDRGTGVKTALGIQRMALQNAREKWLAKRNAAELLMNLAHVEDREPMANADDANSLAKQLVNRNDTDGEGDGVLNIKESWSAEIPACADENFDGQITEDELTGHLAFGERQSRLRVAQMLVDQAMTAPEAKLPEARGLLLLTRSRVLSTLSSTALLQRRTDSKALLSQALEATAEAGKLGLDWPQLMYQDALLHRQFSEMTLEREERLSELQRAEELSRKTLELLKSRQAALTQQARLANLEGEDPAASQGSIQTVLQSENVMELEAWWRLAEILVRQLDLAGSTRTEAIRQEIKDSIVVEMKKLGVHSVFIDLLESQLLVMDGEWAAANLKLTSLQQQIKDDPQALNQVLLLRARCAERLNNPDMQLALARQAVEADPYSIAGRMLLSDGLLDTGRTAEAAETMATLAGTPGMAKQLVTVQISQQLRRRPADRHWGNVEAAIDYLGKQPQSTPFVAVARSELAFAKALSEQDRLSETEVVSGPTEGAIKLLTEGQTILNDAIAQEPENEQLHSTRITYLSRRFDLNGTDRFEQCSALLDQWPEALRTKPLYVIAQANLARLQTAANAKLWLDQRAKEYPEFKSNDQRSIYSAFAQAYAAADDKLTSVKWWLAAAQAEPKDVSSRMSILESLMQDMISNDGELDSKLEEAWTTTLAALEALEAGKDDRKSSAPNAALFDGVRRFVNVARQDSWSNLKEADKRELDAARRQLEQAALVRDSWSLPHRFLGELDVYMQNEEAAMVHFERAIERGDLSETVVDRVAQNYYKRELFDDVNRVIAMYQQNAAAPLSDTLTELSWQTAFRQKRFDQAIDSFSEAAEKKGMDVDSKIRLAMMKFAQNEYSDEVEPLLIEATKLQPESPKGWEALVSLYCRKGEPQKALQAIAESEQKLAAQPLELRPMSLARSYELIAESDLANMERHLQSADRYYRELIAIDPFRGKTLMIDFLVRRSKVGEALSLIAELLSPESGIPEEARAGLKRRQVLLMSSAGNDADFDKALASLQAMTADTSVQDILNLQAQVALLRSRGREADYPRLIELLERIRKLSNNLLSTEQFLQLAAYQQATKSFDGSIQTYKDLLAEDPQNARALTALAMLLIEQGKRAPKKLDDASPYLTRLKTLEPESYRSTYIAVAMLEAQGKNDDAVQELLRFSRRILVKNDPTSKKSLDWIKENTATAISTMLSSRELMESPGVKEALQRAKLAIESSQENQAAMILRQVVEAYRLSRMIEIESVRQSALKIEDLGDFVAAEDLFRQCVEQGQTEASKLALAMFYLRRNRASDGLTECEKQLSAVPLEKVGTVAMNLLNQLPQPDPRQAQPWIERASKAVAEVEPARRQAMRVLTAELMIYARDYDGAMAHYRELLKGNATHLVAMNNLAWLNARTEQNVAEALDLIDAAIRAHGAVPALLDTKAIVLISMKQYELARKVLEEVQDQEQPGVMFRMAEIYAKEGNTTQARAQVTAAIEKGLATGRLDSFDTVVLSMILGEQAAPQ